MKKSQILKIILVLLILFFLIYLPHLKYRFPLHIDEWHHITEALKLKNGDYSLGASSYRVGFHIILAGLSFIVPIILSYQYLPAIWALISVITLFYVVYKKTKNFNIALFSMIFFASIKSNVNIMGLWFFTPLTFSIPFIFLYIYFFTEGLEKQNKRLIITSLLIMLFLIPIHSISVLFAIPFLILYSLFYLNYIKEEWRFFSIFILFPIFGFLFFIYINKTSVITTFTEIFNQLKFQKGWGVLELNNSPLELYSFIGYILAIIGTINILYQKNKKHIPYVLLPTTVVASIIIYKITGISYLSPYQRNLYYFIINIPILSSFGLNFLIEKTNNSIKKLNKKIIITIVITIILIFTFKSYLNTPKQIALYQLINENDYNALVFLSQYPRSNVLAKPEVSNTIYAISNHNPVTSIYFYNKEKREEIQNFFITDCKEKNKIITDNNIKYVLSKEKIDCGWDLIYDEKRYIYKIN